jgi:hypothetical protein
VYREKICPICGGANIITTYRGKLRDGAPSRMTNTEMSVYRCEACRVLARDTPPIPPARLAPFENREQIPKGRAVILSPYSKSVVKPASGFWEEIAEGYSRQGFRADQPIEA